MLRSVGAVLAGFALWTVLWLVSNQATAAVVPEAFNEDGTTGRAGVLLVILALSVVCSVAGGYLTAVVARERASQHALWLGVLLLVVGILVQIQYWAVMPLWYHLLFLALLIPGALIGGRMRAGSPG